MRRRLLAMSFFGVFVWTLEATGMELPQDCTGSKAQSQECVQMMSMASYVEQAKGQAADGQYEAAIKTMDKAIKIARKFPAGLYVEYVIDQAFYAEKWATGIKGEKGLDQALAILNRAIPYLARVDEISTKVRFYNRVSALNMALAEIRKDVFYVEAALENFYHIIEIIEKEANPIYWADVHYNLGLAHASLYGITKDSSQLLLGKTSLLEAFELYDKKTTLIRWAMTVSAMADNDAEAAKAYKRDDLLKSAFNGYEAVIKSLDPKVHQEQLSTAYHNSGLLYMSRGRKTENINDLKQAYSLFERATDLFDEQGRYFEWVRAYSNQAWSLFYVAELTEEDAYFKNAISMVENILEYFPQHKSPRLWAVLVSQRGDIQRGFAVKLRDTDLLKEARQSYKVAIKVYEEQGNQAKAEELGESISATDALLLLLEVIDSQEESAPKEDQGT